MPAYKAGQVVRAKVTPEVHLVVRRYVDNIYYCKVQDDPDRKDLVYFERELEAVVLPNGQQEL